MPRQVVRFIGYLALLALLGATWTRPYVSKRCVIGWDAVTTDQGGGALTGLSGYRVYAAATSGGTATLGVEVAAGVTQVTCAQAQLVEQAAPYYVHVRAFDADDNESVVSNELTIIVSPGRVRIRH